MSVYIQEVLGLLKRNKKKLVLDKQRDHFEFGKLYQNSSLNNAGTYGPRMEPFVVKWGDLVCQATENLTRTQPGSGNLGFVPVYTVPEGSCAWDTVMDSIITQNALGDTITINNGNLVVEGDATVEGDLQVDQNANVNLQLTAGSANILDLTEDRIVIVGPNGELEDDANFTMDGVTFTALVNVQHGSITASPTVPTTTTTLNSNIVLNGPVTDSQGNVGQLSQVLVGLGDGRVIWSDDDVVEALTYGSLWQGNINNLKQELAIGTADQILISDGVTFAWQDNPSVKLPDVLCEVFRIPLWAPDNETIGCSLMIQDGDGLGTPATEVKNDGKLHQTGEVRLDTVTQDDTLTEVLVRDSSAANEVRFRDASTIIPQRGFDTLTMQNNGGAAGKWTQTFLNAYIGLDLSKQGFIDIKGMDNLTDGQHGVVIAENIQAGSVLPNDVIRFPNGWGTVGNLFNNVVTWTPGVDNGYPTSGLLFGESLKLSYINYDVPGGDNTLYWDACCKSNSGNTCPVANDGSIIIDEDTSVGATVVANDDGFGSYGLTYTLVTQIPAGEGSVTLDPATGNWVYTPEPNYFGVTSFQWSVNDGYCDSNIATQTITVRAVADPVIWTSTDPVTAGTYPNLTGGDTWTYTWTVADDDTPCNQLTFTTPSLPSWLTFTNNGDCTGTLSGVVPSAGGSFPVVLNVTDNDGSSDTQTFTIGGLGVTVNTYFQYWSDTSGSMVSTIRRTAKMASVPEVVTRITDNNTGSGSTTLRFGNTVQANLNSGRVNAPDGQTAKSFYCVVPGMSIVGVGPAAARVPAGTTVVSYTDGSIPNLATAVLSNPHTLNQNDIVKFEITNTIMLADYADPANFRNLLQDFYATGGTEASGNGDPTTNGRDQFNTHVYWSHQNAERQIAFFSGGENGTPADGTNYNLIWPSADRVQFLCFADESSAYNMAGSGTGTWADRANSTVTTITDDVTTVKGFISNMVTAAGNNSIYRGIFFPVDYNTGPNGVQINPLLADDGLMATGGLTANGFAYAPQASAYNTTTQTLYPESSGSPTYLTYTAEIADGNTNQYYYNQVKAALNNSGYTL
jgi:hypothetical protein